MREVQGSMELRLPLLLHLFFWLCSTYRLLPAVTHAVLARKHALAGGRSFAALVRAGVARGVNIMVTASRCPDAVSERCSGLILRGKEEKEAKENMEQQGLSTDNRSLDLAHSRSSHMRSAHSTTELQPQLVENWKNTKKLIVSALCSVCA